LRCVARENNLTTFGAGKCLTSPFYPAHPRVGFKFEGLAHTPVEMQGGNGTFLAEIRCTDLADEKGIFFLFGPNASWPVQFKLSSGIKTENGAKAFLPFSARASLLLIQNATAVAVVVAAAAVQTCVRRGRVWHRDRLKRQRHMALHALPFDDMFTYQ
jgi:hypothetical protein